MHLILVSFDQGCDGVRYPQWEDKFKIWLYAIVIGDQLMWRKISPLKKMEDVITSKNVIALLLSSNLMTFGARYSIFDARVCCI